MSEVVYEEFKSVNEIFNYLNANKDLIKKLKFDEADKIILRVFASSLLDDKVALNNVIRWYNLNTSIDFIHKVSQTFKELYDTDICFYKFRLLTGLRGPVDESHFIKAMSYRIIDDELERIAKHKDFPQEAKDYFYETTNDVGYLPQDAQDIFIF